MIRKQVALLILISQVAVGAATFPLNVTRRDNILFRSSVWYPGEFDLGVFAENFFSVYGRNSDGCETDITRTWSDTQDALSMVRGFDPSSEIGQLAAQLNGVEDNGIRGHLIPSGNLKVREMAFVSRYYGCNWYGSLFLPLYFMQYNNGPWEDLTKNITAQDARTHKLLTDNLFNNVQKLGGPTVNNWQQSGLGDLMLEFGWLKHFPQDRPLLKDVYTSLRAGFSFPTGRKIDSNLLFPIPFGQGAPGVFLGGTLELGYGTYMRAGVDVQFLHMFESSECRRIQTNGSQTSLLWLAQAPVRINPGVTQEYILYLEAQRLLNMFSATIAYNFVRHNHDEWTLQTNGFSNQVANNSNRLDEWSMHNILLLLRWDWETKKVNPRLTLFVKHPFHGRRVLQANSIGLEFSLSF